MPEVSEVPFSMSKTKYDLTTYSGRLQHFVDVCDFSTLFYPTSKVMEAQNIIKKYQETGLMCGSNSDMWGYRKLVDAAVHPVTGEIIPHPFRVSAIAPVNIPIVFLMLQIPASNIPGTLFMHWFNQSYNTACNYANRSGADQPIEQIAQAYSLAVGSACTFAYGLGKLFSRMPPSMQRLSFVIPCVATAAANVSNLGFTRVSELTDGAPVKDSTGKDHGLSQVAGQTAVFQTALTRCVLVPCAVLLLPPMIMSTMRSARILPKNARAIVMVELAVIFLSLQAAMPAALAVFPQTISIDASKLEPKFQGRKDSIGNEVTVFYANKGL